MLSTGSIEPEEMTTGVHPPTVVPSMTQPPRRRARYRTSQRAIWAAGTMILLGYALDHGARSWSCLEDDRKGRYQTLSLIIVVDLGRKPDRDRVAIRC